MNPKKSKEVVKVFAKESELPEDLVKAVTDHYWSEVRSSLSNLENCNVSVAGFGIFRVSAKRLVVLREKYKNYLAKLDLMKFNKFKVKLAIENHLSNIEELFSQMRNNMEKKELTKSKRHEFEKNMGQ